MNAAVPSIAPARSAARPDYLAWKSLGFLLALLVSLPLLLIFTQWSALGSGEQDIWQHLLDTKLDRLATNTVLLLLGVGLGVSVLGIALAWLCSTCEFPGRRLFEWALMLPLALPGYVMAFVFLGTFNFAGPVQSFLRRQFGTSAWFPDTQGLGAVVFVFTLVLYPYVYMLVRAAFIAQGRSQMDAARILGLRPFAAFIRVALPGARPAIVAGIALALMETLADFGAVSVFNFDTFTTAIYGAWYQLFNMTVAAQLASLLLLFVALALTLEQYGRRDARHVQDGARRSGHRYVLRGTRAAGAVLLCVCVLGFAFVIPVLQLVLWALRSATNLDPRFIDFLSHSLGLGAIAAAVTVSLALLLAMIKRLPGSAWMQRWQGVSLRVATLGYAVPGSVLAVGITLLFTAVDRQLVASFDMRPVLVGSVFALLLAYVIRFLAVAHAPVDAGLQGIRNSVIEAARSLGASPARILREVYVPLLRPGLITALLLVFVDTMKEMPATLILRPFGWETLAMRVY
ncbi:MAG: iron ABC transporter permease, partial [Pseudomonadota bacterium]|nr:iron ABC transporter permease [Pseudomonadota bacterium]